MSSELHLLFKGLIRNYVNIFSEVKFLFYISTAFCTSNTNATDFTYFHICHYKDWLIVINIKARNYSFCLKLPISANEAKLLLYSSSAFCFPDTKYESREFLNK